MTGNQALHRLLDARDIIGLSADGERIFRGYDNQLPYPPEDFAWDEEYARDCSLSHSDAAELANVMVDRWSIFRKAALARVEK